MLSDLIGAAMRFPFTSEQFLAVFARYNEAVWPMQLVLAAIGIMLAVFAWRGALRGGFVAGALASLWVWMGFVYHIHFFAPINPIAKAFGVAFIIQAALFVRYGITRGTMSFGAPATPVARWVGGSLIAYGLVLYPLIGMLAGQRYPAMPLFGLPCPTTIFTLGLLAWSKKPVPWLLLVVPVAWTFIATSAAFSMGIVEDYALIPAAALLIWARAASRDR